MREPVVKELEESVERLLAGIGDFRPKGTEPDWVRQPGGWSIIMGIREIGMRLHDLNGTRGLRRFIDRTDPAYVDVLKVAFRGIGRDGRWWK